MALTEMSYFHEIQIFTNVALLVLAEIFTIQKFTILSSQNQHSQRFIGPL